MSTVIDELVADAGVSDDGSGDLAAFLSDLEQLADVAPPRPSDELAALLAAPPVPGRNRPKLRLVAAAGAAAAVGAMTVTGVAAAANELPSSAQAFVADLSERLLPSPLHFPRPIPDREEQAPATDQQDRREVVVEPPPTPPGFPIPDEGLVTTAPQRTAEMLTLEPTPTPTPTPSPSLLPGTPTAPAPTDGPTASPSDTATAQPSETAAPSGSAEPTTTPEPSAGPSDGDPRIGESPAPSPTEEPEAGEGPGAGAGPGPQAPVA